jgi:hypothetical protein
MWIDTLVNSILPYKGYIMMGIAWFTHVYCPHVIKVYPYLVENGGIFGIVRRFFFGKPKVKGALINEQLPE